jgi:putative addiction module component (TIGR02574 family)
MINAALLSQVKTLSVVERIELIGAVWETLSSSEVAVSEEEKALLDVRLADMEQNPEDQSTWSEVQARLRQQLP